MEFHQHPVVRVVPVSGLLEEQGEAAGGQVQRRGRGGRTGRGGRGLWRRGRGRGRSVAGSRRQGNFTFIFACVCGNNLSSDLTTERAGVRNCCRNTHVKIKSQSNKTSFYPGQTIDFLESQLKMMNMKS